MKTSLYGNRSIRAKSNIILQNSMLNVYYMDCMSDCACDCACDCDCISDCHGIQSIFQTSVVFQFQTVYLELTTACDNHCAGCGNVFTDRNAPAPANFLSLESLRVILTQIQPVTQRIILTGGEPTLHPDFPTILKLLSERGVSFSLFTNGRWRTPDAIIRLLYRTTGFEGMLISLHGPDASTHECFTRTPNSFAEAAANIRRTADAGLSFNTCCVITRWNYDQVRQTYENAMRLGANKVVFNRYVGRDGDVCAPTDAQLKHALKDIEALRLSGEKVKLTVTTPQCFHPNSAFGCGAGRSFLTVDPWGNVRPCNHAALVMGNLLETPLAEIWASDRWNDWRGLTPEKCRDCATLDFCGGGCKAEALLNNRSCDGLSGVPFPKGEGCFQVLPDRLRPVLTCSAGPMELPGVDCDALDGLENCLDGRHTLRDIAMMHGQAGLDAVGVMHRQGYVVFR